MATTESNLPFVSGLGRALAVADDATVSAAAIQNLLREFGWQVAPDDQQVSGLQAVLGFSAPVAQLHQLLAALEQENADKAVIAEGIFQTARTLYDLIANLSGASLSGLGFPFDQPGFAEEFAEGLAAKLLDDYLQYHLPVLHGALFLLGILDAEEVFPTEEGRLAYTRRSIHWDRISKAISDPPGLFAEVYGWNNGAFRHRRFLDALELLFEYVGLIAHQIRPAEDLHLHYYDEANHAARAIRSLEVPLLQVASADFEAIVEAGLIVLPIPPKGDGSSVQPVGFALTPMIRGTATPDMLDDESHVSITTIGSFATDSAFRFDIRPDDVEIALNTALSEVQGEIAVHASPPEPWIALGDAEGSHLAFLSFSAGFELKGTVGDPEFIVSLNAPQAGGSAAPNLSFVLTFANSDGFLRDIFGSEQHRLDFSLGVQWSSKDGLRFNGQAGFETELPAHIGLGPVTVNGFVISAMAAPNPAKVIVEIGAGMSLKLGPLVATIRNVGLKLEGQQRGPGEPAGTFGDLKLDFGFKPPSGVGLSIDGGGFKGGGFMEYEPDDERYVGMLELQFKNKISLNAIGVLTTRLPGDEDGYSLLIIITSEFQPIQLGYGFTLNGVGGLLGLNRTMNVERLRTGVRDKTLDSVLFPQDIVANANRIISDLRRVFPPSEGRFIFGPMAKIGWGTPTLITIDLGLAIELPEPVTLALLGVLKAVLPDEKKKLLQLRVNFLGVIDFEKEQISFDASLFDSKLLNFTLSGDMALRLNWGADPNFLLTVGGFHPAYEPPPMALPQLRRLTLALVSGKNPRITLESYFAVTSNTVQFGAKVELYAGAGPFNVYGMLAYDALFQFSPFYFIADTKAMFALRRKSKSIASISLDMTLEGTTPWKAKGTAKLKICWFLTVKIRFNKTFGRTEDTLLDDLAILPLLEAELRKSGNWTDSLPGRRQMLVSIKDTKTGFDRPIVHPFGTLSVAQKIVPLNVRIDKVGHQKPIDGNEFAIKFISDGDQAKTSPTKELFAPAQFFDKSDEEKLTSKSFQTYDSGVELSASEQLVSDRVVRREVEYKLSYIDSQRNIRRKAKPIAPYAKAFNSWADVGAVSASPLSARSAGKTTLAPSAVKMSNDDYVLVGTDDLLPIEGAPSVAGGESEIKALMKQITAANPSLLGKIQALPSYELI